MINDGKIVFSNFKYTFYCTQNNYRTFEKFTFVLMMHYKTDPQQP